jgi:hypothetical protein
MRRPSRSVQLSSGGGATEMIDDGRSNTDRKVLVKRLCEHLLPSAQMRRLWRPGFPVTTPRPGNSHIDPFCHFSPGQTLVTQVEDLFGGGWVRACADRTHGDTGVTKMIMDHVRSNAHLGADLAQSPALGVQLCRALNVHGATLNELRQSSAFVVEAYGLRRCPWAVRRTGQAKRPASSSLATNIDARVVAVGNPDDPASHFATVCKPGSGWAVKKISAFDTPAYTGEQVPAELLPLLVSPEWVEERKLRWGVNSPIYQSKVLGEFPDVSDDSLILPKWIEAAQKRTIKRNGRPVLAWDIARFGEDESVGMRREGAWVRVYRAHHKADTMTTTGHIAKAHREINAEKGLNDFPTHVVDVVGVGAGVYDRLVELGIPVVPYNGGEAPFDKERFVNARAEDFWNLREIFEMGEIDIDELDDVLAAQLGSIKWTVDSRGRIKIESKDDMRKRGMPSPDRADTLAIVMSRRATGGSAIDVESHRGESITGDLMTKAW